MLLLIVSAGLNLVSCLADLLDCYNIGTEAFTYCESLASITIPKSVISLDEYAFYGCHSLESITIPDSVTSIGEGVFKECTSLKSITISKFVSSIGENAFDMCYSLTSINVADGNSKFSSINGILYDKAREMLISCPRGKSGDIKVPDSVTSVSDNAFYGCSSMTSVTIPKSVTYIGWSAFYDCEDLKDIYYAGTQQQWNSMLIDEYGDEIDLGLNDNVIIHYNYVLTGLSITSHSANVTTKVNDSVSFSVKAQGEDLTYQWYYKKAGQTAWNKWGARITATTTATANATWNGMQVYCKVTDQYGNSIDSNPATITIKPDLKITAQPTDKTVKLGESLTLSVKAEGDGLTYQWYYKKSGQTAWSKWNGRTHASETCTPNATWNGIQLYCEVTDSYGNWEDSAVAKITVTQDLKITTQPVNQTIKLGNALTLLLKAEGSGLTYQWYFKKSGQSSFTKWTNRTHASETVTPNESWNGIQLYCVVKDSAGKSVQSNTIKVTFSDAVTIVTQPANVTVKTGADVKFTVKAEGVGLTYQWYYKKATASDWSKWSGRTAASTTATSNASWDGMQVRCIVKNSSGKSITSNAAKITLSDVLAITQQPTNVTTQAGKNVTFTVKAKGAGLTYQWYYKKSGQTSWNQWGARTTASTTATANATWNGMQVRCVVKDSTGKTVTSSAATITIK